MSQLSWNEIQDRATEFASKWSGETYEKGESQSFWSDFLTVFGIDRRRHGAYFEYAIKKGSGSQGFIDMFWPGKMLAEQKSGGKDLGKAGVQAYEYLETMPDHDLPQAIVVSDFGTFQLKNLITRDEINFKLEDFPRHVKEFAFLIDQQVKKTAEEEPVNRQAAEAMARLHNQLRDDNYTGHDLELLLVRLVFCMFADDSGIFEHGQLHDYIASRTSDDGSDLGARLVQVFQTLNTPKDSRQHSLDEALVSLEYVNGGLFAEQIATPSFSGQMRKDLLKAMELNWSQVSPAIFGSMFQGVMDEKERRNLGAHYTSEKNILRVIKPLFLDDLYDEFAACLKAGPRKKYDELRALQNKLAELKFLDPACGCGNFLVITYRELRLLEHKVVAQLSKDANQIDMLATSGAGSGLIKCNVDQMYGIEIEEFPSLIAQTALWLTDHQMNLEFSKQSGKSFKRLPLSHSATIVHANALTKDWSEVVAPSELNYILGNPPFLGQTYQSEAQKQEVAGAFSGIKKTGVLDLVSAWYGKATGIMKQNSKIQAALVSTNSITQGEQVGILWSYLFEQGVKINFAHRTFKWTNDAKGVAGVHCVVIGFALYDKSDKYIFEYDDIKADPIEKRAFSISPTLLENHIIQPQGIKSTMNIGTVNVTQTTFVTSRSKSLSDVPEMVWGNKPVDGGNLILSQNEMEELLKTEPGAAKFIKKLVGAREFIQNIPRYCLWLVGADPSELKKMPLVMDRISRVRATRLASTDEGARKLAIRPTEFRDIKNPYNYVLIPSVSSERREYIPIGMMYEDTIPTNLVHTIPGANMFHFGVLTSRMHMAWMRAVAGRLESRYRYSKDIVYNNFIWPEVTDEQKFDIEKLAQSVLDARAEFPDSSLADLYDPLTMPPVLAKAHKALDRAVDRLYSPKGFTTDAKRVAMLFESYNRTIS
jgi:hypothetical protein